MGKFAAYLNLALAVAWLALFFTNDALFVSHEVDLSDHLRGDAFAMAWAGSAICSRLYIALVNYGVELRGPCRANSRTVLWKYLLGGAGRSRAA